MADQLTSTTSTATTTGLGSLTGTLQGQLNTLTSKSSNLLDRLLPPPTRAELKSKLSAFATEHPLLASFLLSQIALSGLPLLLFLITSVSVVVFALLTGVLVGVIGALVFVVLALGVALFVLLPTLFVTTFSAVAVWLWGVSAYYLVKWFNEKKVPGIHRPLKEGLMEETGLGKSPILGEGGERTNESEKMNGSMDESEKQDGAEEREKVGGDARADGHGSGEHMSNGTDGQGQGETPVKATHHKNVEEVDNTFIRTPIKTLMEAGDGVTNNVTAVLA